MAHAKRAMSEYDQSEQWGMRIRIEMSNAKGAGGGSSSQGGGGRGGGGRGRGSWGGDRGGRGRGGRGAPARSAPYPPRGGAARYIKQLKTVCRFLSAFFAVLNDHVIVEALDLDKFYNKKLPGPLQEDLLHHTMMGKDTMRQEHRLRETRIMTITMHHLLEHQEILMPPLLRAGQRLIRMLLIRMQHRQQGDILQPEIHTTMMLIMRPVHTQHHLHAPLQKLIPMQLTLMQELLPLRLKPILLPRERTHMPALHHQMHMPEMKQRAHVRLILELLLKIPMQQTPMPEILTSVLLLIRMQQTLMRDLLPLPQRSVTRMLEPLLQQQTPMPGLPHLIHTRGPLLIHTRGPLPLTTTLRFSFAKTSAASYSISII